jgi:hypothetical protein
MIPKFIRHVKDNTNMEQVTDRVFQGVDIEPLDTGFRAWADGERLEGVDRNDADDNEVGTSDEPPASG